MKVYLDSLNKKYKRAKVATKKTKNFYKKAATFELLSIMIYQKALKKYKHSKKEKDLTKIEKLDTLICEDKKHYEMLSIRYGKKIKINFLTLLHYLVINFLFGFTFSLRILEKVENKLYNGYCKYFDDEEYHLMIKQEKTHLDLLEKILEEHTLEYISLIVLGLNDAIVEMTASIAGYTFALGSVKMVYLISLITGISAGMSMSASSFLSARQTKGLKPLKASFLTGISYLVTVFFLTIPYLIFQSKIVSISVMLFVGILIIFIFNFYMSVAKKQSLKRNFITMSLISIIISLLSFSIGLLINKIGIS